MKQRLINSTQLFNYPSFLKGVARIFDFHGNIDVYDYSQSDDEADYNALKSDWKMVGYDIKNAITKYESIAQ